MNGDPEISVLFEQAESQMRRMDETFATIAHRVGGTVIDVASGKPIRRVQYKHPKLPITLNVSVEPYVWERAPLGQRRIDSFEFWAYARVVRLGRVLMYVGMEKRLGNFPSTSVELETLFNEGCASLENVQESDLKPM
jgi:hypothetical protein